MTDRKVYIVIEECGKEVGKVEIHPEIGGVDLGRRDDKYDLLVFFRAYENLEALFRVLWAEEDRSWEEYLLDNLEKNFIMPSSSPTEL